MILFIEMAAAISMILDSQSISKLFFTKDGGEISTDSGRETTKMGHTDATGVGHINSLCTRPKQLYQLYQIR